MASIAEVASMASGTKAVAFEALPETVVSTGASEFIRKRKKVAPRPASKLMDAGRRWPGTIRVPLVGETVRMFAVVKITGFTPPEFCHGLPATSVSPDRSVLV